jgi:uncharacterized protein DUF4386
VPGPRKLVNTARLAGALYLLMMPFAAFTLYVRYSRIVGSDPATTASNILAAPGLYRAAIITWLTSQVISVFLVVQLYRLLKPVDATLALLMLALALIGVPIVFANESHSFAVLLLLTDPLVSASVEQSAADLMLQLQLHERGIALAQIFWGLWLFPLGWLVFSSRFLPRWLGILLLIAGFGYLVDFFTAAMYPASGLKLTQFTFIGELLFPLWLIFRVKQEGQVAPPSPSGTLT